MELNKKIAELRKETIQQAEERKRLCALLWAVLQDLAKATAEAEPRILVKFTQTEGITMDELDFTARDGYIITNSDIVWTAQKMQDYMNYSSQVRGYCEMLDLQYCTRKTLRLILDEMKKQL